MGANNEAEPSKAAIDEIADKAWDEFLRKLERNAKRFDIRNDPRLHDYFCQAIDTALSEQAKTIAGLTESKAFIVQWYAQRWERLKDWARKEIPADLTEQFFSIVANGTKDPCEPPTYGQQMNILRHENKEQAATIETLEKSIAERGFSPMAAKIIEQRKTIEEQAATIDRLREGLDTLLNPAYWPRYTTAEVEKALQYLRAQLAGKE